MTSLAGILETLFTEGGAASIRSNLQWLGVALPMLGFIVEFTQKPLWASGLVVLCVLVAAGLKVDQIMNHGIGFDHYGWGAILIGVCAANVVGLRRWFLGLVWKIRSKGVAAEAGRG